MSNPFFSIIIPVYNVQDYLAQCLDSVLNQTFQHYEIILIDDGSSDDSSQICAQYALKHPQITLLKQPNQGVSVARNRGIQLARGEYIVFIDPDDYWIRANGLEEVLQIIKQQNKPDIILFGLKIENMTNHQISNFLFDTKNLSNDFQQDFETLVQRQIFFSSTTTKFIRRQILLEHHIIFQPNRRFEDFAFYFDLALHLETYAIYNEMLYYYRFMRPESSSDPKKGHWQKSIDYLDLLTERLPIVQQMSQTNHPSWRGLFYYWHANFKYVEQWSHSSKPLLFAALMPNLQICLPIVNELRTILDLPLMKIPQSPKRQFTFNIKTSS